MIDRTHPLPVVRQCQVLQLARSSAYYQQTPTSETTLALMGGLTNRICTIPLPGLGCCAICYGTRAMPLGDAKWPPSCAGWGLSRCIGNRI